MKTLTSFSRLVPLLCSARASQGKSDTALRPELPSTAKVIYRVAEVNWVKKLV